MVLLDINKKLHHETKRLKEKEDKLNLKIKHLKEDLFDTMKTKGIPYEEKQNTRNVAVKEMKFEFAAMVETTVVTTINQPNLVKAFGIGVYSNICYIVME